MCVALVSSSI